MHSKGKHKKEKPQKTNQQQINLQNIQRAHAVQLKTNKQKTLNPKMGRRPKQMFLQRRNTDGQKEHEKMLNITN